MLVKCLCNNCSGHLEFESSEAGQRVDCPHCGMETVLYVPQAPLPQQQPIAPPPPIPLPTKAVNPNLRRCADCGKDVSIRAESCPNCGAAFVRRKKHGVFFYVFWGVISLIVTGVILTLGLLMLGGFFAGVGEAVKESKKTGASITSKSVPLTVQEKENAQAILSKLRRSKDEVTGTIWLKPSWADGYDNQIYLYIGVTQTDVPFLRLKMEYKGGEMLIIKRFVFRIDDKVETIEPSGMLKSDYVVDNHWEWFDELPEQHLDVVEKIAKGNKVLMRYDGRQSSHDRTVSAAEKQSLGQMLSVYRYLKVQGEASL
jgi:hypothetical protein